jgi:hypothetical protein
METGMKSRPLPAVIRSALLLFCLVFPLTFMHSILHEGGHALDLLAHGLSITILYAHPFCFAGFARPMPTWNSVWMHASGTVVALLVSLLIFILLWKRRSISNLPLVMLFPWIAILSGVGVIYIPARTGDFYNIMHLTGLPGAVFYVPGVLLILLGIFFFVSLLPLLGLAPEDGRCLFAVPAGLLLWSILSIAVAYLFVPGSPIDVQYPLRDEIIQTANSAPIMAGIMGVLIAAIYVGLYRWMYPRLPAWLRSETVNLTWKDLRLPALLAASSVVIGLIVIT